MKITIVQGAFLPVPARLGGAVEKVWFELGREFSRRGHEVVHVSRSWEGLPARERDADSGVEYRRVSGFDTPRSLLRLKALDLVYSARVLRHLPRADILVTHTFWLPVLCRDASRGRLYVHVARYPKGQLRFYSRAARLQTVSGAVLDAMREQAPALADRMNVIPYPLLPPLPAADADTDDDDDAAEQRRRRPDRERTVLYAGRIHPEKGIGLLLEGFHRFLTRNPGVPWRLALVGPWEARHGGGGESYWRELRQQAATLGLGEAQVEWVGPVFDPAALAEHYRAAALFVYPSLAARGETFGVAPLEAMAHGCPVLVSGLACFRDFIADGRTGFVFDHLRADAADALAAALGRLLCDAPEECARVAQAGRAKAREFTLARVADAFLTDFASLLPARETSSSPGAHVPVLSQSR